MAARIASGDDLRTWLLGRANSEAVAIAARVAARALPLITNEPDAKLPRGFADFTLKTARATALTWVVAVYPTRANAAAFAARTAASASASDAASSSAANPAASSARAATFAARTVIHPANAADFAASAAGFAAHAAGAAYASIWSAVQTDAQVLERGGAAALVDMPLWNAPVPPWVAEHWSRLKGGLRYADRWTFWIEWYEALLAGRPLWPELTAEAREALEVSICLIDDEIWAEGAPVVNAEIERLIAQAMPARIAKQGPGPHFGLSAEDVVTPAAHWEYDEAGNIPPRIRSLLPFARRAAADLAGALPFNDPYKLRRDAESYLLAVDCEPEQVDWGVLYGVGVFVENAASAAERDIADRLLPPLEDPTKKALDTLRALHLNLITASGEGRALMEQADALRLTREEQQALRNDASAVAVNLANAPDVATPEAAEQVMRAAEAMAQGPHAERGSEFGLAAIGNISVVFISAAVLASFVRVGLATGGAVGDAIAGASGWVGYEALKKSEAFAEATKALGGKYDDLVGASRGAVLQQLIALAPFRTFVRANEAELRRIAEKSTRMRWARRYIDFIVGSGSPKEG